MAGVVDLFTGDSLRTVVIAQAGLGLLSSCFIADPSVALALFGIVAIVQGHQLLVQLVSCTVFMAHCIWRCFCSAALLNSGMALQQIMSQRWRECLFRGLICSFVWSKLHSDPCFMTCRSSLSSTRRRSCWMYCV